MNVFAFLKSLDEILYEVVSWFIFYPLTLWKVIKRPLVMMIRAFVEVSKDGENRFDDALSPPLLLLLTILVSHAIELSLIGQSTLVTQQDGLAGYIKDDTSLIMLRMVAFSTFPLVFAVRMIRARKRSINRKSLEPEFFAQSYGNAPYALLLSIASTLFQVKAEWATVAASALGLASIVTFLTVQTIWFRRQLDVSSWRAFRHVIRAYFESLFVLAVLGLILGGDIGL